MTHAYKVLFLCTGNSARSVFGEYLLRRIGALRFESFSAGSFPTGKVNPNAIEVLKDIYNIDASAARSKSWEEFKDIKFDFVITVCDNAKELCPIWPGQPIIAHWGMEDPAEATGTRDQILRVFRHTAYQLQRRLELFVALPVEKLDRLKLERLVGEIGTQKVEAQ